MSHLYRHFDKDGILLYVGISLSALNRLGQHKDHSHWFDTISRVEIENFNTREEALVAESLAIFNEKPTHNIKQPRRTQIMEDIARQNKAQYVIERSQMSREELTGRVVRFNMLYTYQEAGAALGIGSYAVRVLVENKKLGSITLPPRKEGLSPHGTPFKEKRMVSGWQLITYLENLHEGVF